MTLNEKFVKKRGYLLKKGNGVIKDWKQRYFVLYRSFLYYYETNQVCVFSIVLILIFTRIIFPWELSSYLNVQLTRQKRHLRDIILIS